MPINVLFQGGPAVAYAEISDNEGSGADGHARIRHRNGKPGRNVG